MRPTLNTYNIDALGDFVEEIENRNKEITAMNKYCSELEGMLLEAREYNNKLLERIAFLEHNI